MTDRNSFQELMEEEEKRFSRKYERKIQANLGGTLGLFRFAGDLLNIFVPRVADVLVLGLGGRQSVKPDKSIAEPPSQIRSQYVAGKSPEAPEFERDESTQKQS